MRTPIACFCKTREDYIMPELNPEQKLAATHGDGPLLVVAGPGTGKTRVITERIVYLLSGESGFSPLLRPENILALTFTEKAAGEMKHRVAKALPDLETAPAISTFHAFCYQVLCKHHEERLLLDKIDVWIFLRRRIAQLGLNFYQKLAEPGAFLHDLNDFFSRCQDELIEPDDFDSYVRQCEREFFARHPELQHATQAMPAAEKLEWDEILKKKELAHVFHASRQMIEENGTSSLGSLVSETVALWRRDPAALEQARAQFRAVLVDEFQDTNYAQAELLKLLVPPPYAITAVGDDDQAIYRFRGASHGAFEMFGQTFPGHQTVYLTQNYRSTQKILRAAGVVIAHNDRYAQKPVLTSLNAEGSAVFLVKAKNPEDEAAWIADEIERLARKGTSYGSVAVLYRAHNYRDILVHELNSRNIPLSIRGLSILPATVLRDFVAWLRVIHSPHDNISLTRVMLAPCWRIPEPIAQLIRERASHDRTSLYDVLAAAPAAPITEGLTATGWGEFQELLKTFRRLARSASVPGLASKLVNRLGWPGAASAIEQRYLEAFHKFISQWDEKSETHRLAEFIDYFDYFLEAGGKIEAPEGPANAVQMMTVHAAKGLEFPVVFVIGVSPRRFPSTERIPVIEFPAALRKGPTPPRDIHLQEERRLFFVALTRAKERLYVSSVSKSERQQSVLVQNLLSDPAVRARDLEIIEAPERKTPPAAMYSQNQPLQMPRLVLSETARQTQRTLFDDAEANA
ncbi:MAG: ATP-dependent helicase, partial [Terriglobia bacterium]